MDKNYQYPKKVADLGGRTFVGELYQSRKPFRITLQGSVFKCKNKRYTFMCVHTHRLLLFRF